MEHPADVIIYGAGGLGCQIQDILEQDGRYALVAFLDSDPAKHGTEVGGLPVLGGVECVPDLVARGITGAIVAIGDNLVRAAHAETLQAHGMRLVSAIHPLASISPSATLGVHVVIGPRATVCVHAKIHAHAILSAGAICEHDNVIGFGAFLGPAVRLAGGVHIGDYATLEIGASVIPGRRVGDNAVVRAGAVVIHDLPPRSIVSGAPAVPVESPAKPALAGL
jgi:sugar O-acyltransferase (sialic acid O-acetyltransferase NeuD family)